MVFSLLSPELSMSRFSPWLGEAVINCLDCVLCVPATLPREETHQSNEKPAGLTEGRRCRGEEVP